MEVLILKALLLLTVAGYLRYSGSAFASRVLIPDNVRERKHAKRNKDQKAPRRGRRVWGAEGNQAVLTEVRKLEECMRLSS